MKTLTITHCMVGTDGCHAVEVEVMGAGDIQREVLPIPDRSQVGLVTYDAKDPATSFPPIEPLRPPTGALNVLVVLLDDTGFGAASAFGDRSTPPPPSGWLPRG